jgi:type IV pilus assembly protein PilA
MKRTAGFTLIELMIVIAIIAILSAIAISVYQDSTAKSELSEAFSSLEGIKTDVTSYANETGTCPSVGNGGILTPASYSGKYVASAAVSGTGTNCVITAMMRTNTVAQKLRGKKVVFTMNPNNGSAKWTCSSDAPINILPRSCH